CRDCQRLTGAAFALNMWIEKSCVEADHAALKSFLTTAGSGKPHQVFYCGACTTHLWSKYHAAPGDTLLVRAGTLDHPEEIAPDVHIFTRSKLPWLVLPPGARAFEAFYKLAEVWPEASRERLRRNVEAQG
ncbi:MAG: GFA family protein, partial [Acetobacteraceae bacterium]